LIDLLRRQFYYIHLIPLELPLKLHHYSAKI